LFSIFLKKLIFKKKIERKNSKSDFSESPAYVLLIGIPRAKCPEGRDALTVIYSLWLLCVLRIVGHIRSLVVLVCSFRSVARGDHMSVYAFFDASVRVLRLFFVSFWK
jgi:hypothetical protein